MVDGCLRGFDTEVKMNNKKKSMLEALKAKMGNVTAACHAVGVSRKTFYQWKKEDEEFRTKSEEMSEVVLDIVEDALLSQIQNGNSTSTIFYLKTKGKSRGYIEKQEIESTSKVDVTSNSLDISCLTLEEKKTLRDLQRKLVSHNEQINESKRTMIVFTNGSRSENEEEKDIEYDD
ncbi:terminase small subunit [Sphingobacterium daejeonense]|uniref:terminase small subunit n=1 Tax=Sphingobacterium daejeonense TaxID=371142 RepID=UPI0010C31894|nr:terminase small subunit [Sphingobacterium daejeonense]VTQ00301.1 Uncharacterised protein [Sphingobacterium daejeonense]